MDPTLSFKHLSEDDLRALMFGTLPEARRREADRHRAECNGCGQRYARMTAEVLGAVIEPDLQPQAEPRPGDVLAGRFEVIRRVGRGATSVVFRARDRELGRDVAIKIAPRNDRTDREARVLAQIKHSNVVEVHDVVPINDGRLGIVMEYIDGKTLEEHSRGLSPTDVVHLFCAICEGLQAIHNKGFLHLDLKPGNILVDLQGIPRIVDLGLVHIPTAESAGAPPTRTFGEFQGTIAYAAPEQFDGDPQRLGVFTDIYSLGVILYKLLAGQRPYGVPADRSEAIRTIREVEPAAPSLKKSDLPRGLDAVVLKTLAKHPPDRFQSASQLLQALRRFAVAPRELRRRRLRVALPAAALLLALAFGIFAMRGAGESQQALKARMEAEALVASSRSRINSRTDLPTAVADLERASQSCPSLSQAHFWRGIANALLAMQAPLGQERADLTERAIQSFRAAHEAEHGTWPIGDNGAPVPVAAQRMAGSLDALRMAAKVCRLADPDATRASLLLGAVHSLPASQDDDRRMSYHLYDSSRDLLRVPHIDGKSPAQAHAEADHSATIRRCLRRQVTTLNPALDHESSNAQVMELLYDPLVFVDKSGRFIPNPAMLEDVEFSENLYEATVRIKPGLRWHDGAPLTASDIEFSWNQLDPKHNARSAIASIDAVSEVALEVTFATPTRNPLWDLTFPILSKAWFNELLEEAPNRDSRLAHRRYGREPVGNGPYRLARSSHDFSEIELVRWDDYGGEEPYIRRVVFCVVEDRSARIQAIAAGKFHQAQLSGTEYLWDVNGPSFQRLRKLHYERGQCVFITWNYKAPIFAGENRAVRRALGSAINTEWVRDFWFDGLYEPCAGPFHPSNWAFSSEMQELGFDRKAASRALSTAGWRVSTSDGQRRPAETPMTIRLQIDPRSEETAFMLRELIADMRQVGIEPIVDQIDSSGESQVESTWIGRVLGFQEASHPHLGRRRWVTDGEENKGQYSNLQADRLYDLAKLETGEPAQARIYQQIQREIDADQPCAFLWWVPSLWVVREDLRGIETSDRGLVGFHPGPRAWWLPH